MHCQLIMQVDFYFAETHKLNTVTTIILTKIPYSEYTYINIFSKNCVLCIYGFVSEPLRPLSYDYQGLITHCQVVYCVYNLQNGRRHRV